MDIVAVRPLQSLFQRSSGVDIVLEVSENIKRKIIRNIWLDIVD